eukprot:gene15520-21608_t
MGVPKSMQLVILAIFGLCVPAYTFTFIENAKAQQLLLTSAAVSVLGFLATVAAKTLKRGICGKDLNKKGTELGEVPIPESAGLAVGCIFLLCVTIFELLHYYDMGSIAQWLGSGFQGNVPQRELVSDSWVVDYNAALATIGFMMFLGFADDVLDIPWRVKLVLPLFASLPLLVAYNGGTAILVPKPLHGVMGLSNLLELGIFYQGFMMALTIFCTNSINILAGVNGLEAGQTFIIACAVLVHNFTTIAAHGTDSVADSHLFSAYLMLPLVGCTLGLLVHNWYPSKVFVGDTFTYFAGMAIAVAGILGHFSETLLLLMIPQIFNFVYSIPQLFKFVPCPRHRLPVFDPKTGLLRPKDQPDWNVVNLMLQLTGNTTENMLCIRILLFQIPFAPEVLASSVRHALNAPQKMPKLDCANGDGPHGCTAKPRFHFRSLFIGHATKHANSAALPAKPTSFVNSASTRTPKTEAESKPTSEQRPASTPPPPSEEELRLRQILEGFQSVSASVKAGIEAATSKAAEAARAASSASGLGGAASSSSSSASASSGFSAGSSGADSSTSEGSSTAGSAHTNGLLGAVLKDVRATLSPLSGIYSATRLYTGPVADMSTFAAATELVLVQQQQSAWTKTWSSMQEKFPFLKALGTVKVTDTKMYRRGQEMVDDLKDKYETSDHPAVHRVEEMKERIMSGSEATRAMQEIRYRDPNFDMNFFVKCIKLDAPVVTKAFLTRDLDQLKEHCGPELLERFTGIFKHFTEHGAIEDPTILHTSEVEIVEMRTMDDDPFIIAQFNCQQLKCIRDKFGNVIEGSPETIQRVFYFWGLQMEKSPIVTADGKFIPPRWAQAQNQLQPQALGPDAQQAFTQPQQAGQPAQQKPAEPANPPGFFSRLFSRRGEGAEGGPATASAPGPSDPTTSTVPLETLRKKPGDLITLSYEESFKVREEKLEFDQILFVAFDMKKGLGGVAPIPPRAQALEVGKLPTLAEEDEHPLITPTGSVLPSNAGMLSQFQQQQGLGPPQRSGPLSMAAGHQGGGGVPFGPGLPPTPNQQQQQVSWGGVSYNPSTQGISGGGALGALPPPMPAGMLPPIPPPIAPPTQPHMPQWTPDPNDPQQVGVWQQEQQNLVMQHQNAVQQYQFDLAHWDSMQGQGGGMDGTDGGMRVIMVPDGMGGMMPMQVAPTSSSLWLDADGLMTYWEDPTKVGDRGLLVDTCLVGCMRVSMVPDSMRSMMPMQVVPTSSSLWLDADGLMMYWEDPTKRTKDRSYRRVDQDKDATKLYRRYPIVEPVGAAALDSSHTYRLDIEPGRLEFVAHPSMAREDLLLAAMEEALLGAREKMFLAAGAEEAEDADLLVLMDKTAKIEKEVAETRQLKEEEEMFMIRSVEQMQQVFNSILQTRLAQGYSLSNLELTVLQKPPEEVSWALLDLEILVAEEEAIAGLLPPPYIFPVPQWDLEPGGGLGNFRLRRPLCSRLQQERPDVLKAAVAKQRYMVKLFVNSHLVGNSKEASMGEDFVLHFKDAFSQLVGNSKEETMGEDYVFHFKDAFSIQVVRWPESIIMQIYEKHLVRDVLVAQVYVAIPGVGGGPHVDSLARPYQFISQQPFQSRVPSEDAAALAVGDRDQFISQQPFQSSVLSRGYSGTGAGGWTVGDRDQFFYQRPFQSRELSIGYGSAGAGGWAVGDRDQFFYQRLLQSREPSEDAAALVQEAGVRYPIAQGPNAVGPGEWVRYPNAQGPDAVGPGGWGNPPSLVYPAGTFFVRCGWVPDDMPGGAGIDDSANRAQILNWLGHNKIDPNDPRNAALMELLKAHEAQHGGVVGDLFRLDLFPDIALPEDRASSKRFNFLSRRWNSGPYRNSREGVLNEWRVVMTALCYKTNYYLMGVMAHFRPSCPQVSFPSGGSFILRFVDGIALRATLMPGHPRNFATHQSNDGTSGDLYSPDKCMHVYMASKTAAHSVHRIASPPHAVLIHTETGGVRQVASAPAVAITRSQMWDLELTVPESHCTG